MNARPDSVPLEIERGDVLFEGDVPWSKAVDGLLLLSSRSVDFRWLGKSIVPSSWRRVEPARLIDALLDRVRYIGHADPGVVPYLNLDGGRGDRLLVCGPGLADPGPIDGWPTLGADTSNTYVPVVEIRTRSIALSAAFAGPSRRDAWLIKGVLPANAQRSLGLAGRRGHDGPRRLTGSDVEWPRLAPSVPVSLLFQDVHIRRGPPGALGVRFIDHHGHARAVSMSGTIGVREATVWLSAAELEPEEQILVHEALVDSAAEHYGPSG